jgi:hypothetical protein
MANAQGTSLNFGVASRVRLSTMPILSETQFARSYFFLEYRADFSRTAAARLEFRFAEYVNLTFAVNSLDCGLITHALRRSK